MINKITRLIFSDRQVELSTAKGKEKQISKVEKSREIPILVKKSKTLKKKGEKGIELLPVVSPSGDLNDEDDNEEDSAFFKSMLPVLKRSVIIMSTTNNIE